MKYLFLILCVQKYQSTIMKIEKVILVSIFVAYS